MENKPFRQELESWIRFGEQECVTRGDRLSVPTTTGNPSRQTHITVVSKRLELPCLYLIKTIRRTGWLEANRAYQRFVLVATKNMGVRNAMLNQPVEDADARLELTKALNLQGRPDLIVRFGSRGTVPSCPIVEAVLEQDVAA